MPDTRPVLNVVVVTYHSADHVGALLDSLPAAALGLELRTVVVDNGSTDGTAEVVAAHPTVEFLQTGANLGYSGAINVGRAHVGPGPLAILNPDLTLAPGALATMFDASGAEGVGIVVPTLLGADGETFPHLRREPSVSGALGDSLFGDHWPSRPRVLTDVLRRPADYTAPRDVAWAGGAAWLITAACNAAVGRWDEETFFLYSEETDYARRARDLGFRVCFAPAARAVHHGGGSGTSPALLALLAVNRLRYFARYNSPRRSRAFAAAIAVGHLLRSAGAGHRYAFAALIRPALRRDLPARQLPVAGAHR